MKKILLGRHTPFLKSCQLLGTIEDFIKIGANSGAIYISNSRTYAKTYPIDDELTKKGKKLASEYNIDIKNIIVHAPLIGNLSNADKENNIYNLTVKSYIEDLKRMKKVGLKYFNFHPGSFADKNKAINQCIEGINYILNATKNDKTVMLIETMPKKGNVIGTTFEEIQQIIKGVEQKLRIGVCIDTCHIWDGGYDIRNNFDKVLKSFDKIIGLNKLKALHINDSKNDLGSNKDRHDNIGKGKIGLIALRKIVNHPKLRELPKILETPYDDDREKWKKEINLLR